MATVKGSLITADVKGASLKQIIFSGTVKLSSVGVVRDIKGYKVGVPEKMFETVSDSSGNWSLDIPGGSNDKFRIICVGGAGENSQIYDHIAE